MQDSQTLKKLYPRRILTARYEDLALKPIDFATRLLNFAGLRMDRALRQYVWSITSTRGNFTDVMWQTKRSDSRRTAGQWRFDLDFGSVAVVDALCADLYRQAGYLPLPMRHLQKNLRVASHRGIKAVPGLWTW